jgi:two-component system, NarL family, response regulator NreC
LLDCFQDTTNGLFGPGIGSKELMTQIDYGTALSLPVPESDTPLRLVLVEDHAVLRDGLRALLELDSGMVIVGEYACVESSLDGIHRLQPDVVLMDLALPKASGIVLIGEIQRLSPRSRKLVLTGSDCAQQMRAALHAGADGYVLKDASRAELMFAIRTVSVGARFLCKATASRVLSGFLLRDKPLPSPAHPSPLTVREREVLIRIAHGDSNKMVARELGLSPKTVAKHRANFMRKLSLRNTAAVTMYAIKNGLAGSDPLEVQSPDIGFTPLSTHSFVLSRSSAAGT